MLGVGIGGIGTTILRAVTLAMFPVANLKEPENRFLGVLTYSIIVCLINLCCALGQWRLMKNEFAIFHLW